MKKFFEYYVANTYIGRDEEAWGTAWREAKRVANGEAEITRVVFYPEYDGEKDVAIEYRYDAKCDAFFKK